MIGTAEEMKAETRRKYPKLFRITATIRAPAKASEEDVRKLMRSKFPALAPEKIEEVKE